MIKLFRNIPKNLAAENKIPAYLRYAIGEIVLGFNCIINTFFEHFSFFLILEIKNNENNHSLRASIKKAIYCLS